MNTIEVPGGVVTITGDTLVPKHIKDLKTHQIYANIEHHCILYESIRLQKLQRIYQSTT